MDMVTPKANSQDMVAVPVAATNSNLHRADMEGTEVPHREEGTVVRNREDMVASNRMGMAALHNRVDGVASPRIDMVIINSPHSRVGNRLRNSRVVVERVRSCDFVLTGADLFLERSAGMLGGLGGLLSGKLGGGSKPQQQQQVIYQQKPPKKSGGGFGAGGMLAAGLLCCCLLTIKALIDNLKLILGGAGLLGGVLLADALDDDDNGMVSSYLP
jgi:hypothetical protein